jgi:hypothetical protein
VGSMLAPIVVVVLAVGCARAGELRAERRSVEIEGAQSVNTELSMATGNMTVGGGAHNLMDATFTYNVPEWKPEVNYGGRRGTLRPIFPSMYRLTPRLEPRSKPFQTVSQAKFVNKAIPLRGYPTEALGGDRIFAG